MVRPALVSGAETWATTKSQEGRLEVNEMMMLRRIVWSQDEREKGKVVRKYQEAGRMTHAKKNDSCTSTRKETEMKTGNQVERLW